MDIWIIRNGEKKGPIPDYEIRHKIESGELTPATPAWHEGLDSWKVLGEMDLFTREFSLDHDTGPPPLPNLPEKPAARPPSSPQEPSPTLPRLLGRRFWARWFDLSVFSGLWWISMWAVGRDIEETLRNPWNMILLYVPWFMLEALLIHRFGASPGKWLLGLSVQNKDGSRLTLAESTRRALRVLFTGIGFGWGFLTLFCQALSFFTARRLGAPLWDYAAGHQVVSSGLKPARIVTLVILFMAALQLQMIVVSPYVFEEFGEKFPTFKEEYQRNPPWHLPKRS